MQLIALQQFLRRWQLRLCFPAIVGEMIKTLAR